MAELREKGTEKLKADLGGVFYEHTCGAEDNRECSMMRHQILAEVHRSNAPAWVAEELEKRLYCQGCWTVAALRQAGRGPNLMQ
jgi:hypothetical protein